MKTKILKIITLLILTGSFSSCEPPSQNVRDFENPSLEKLNLKSANHIVLYSEYFKAETASEATEIALQYLQAKREIFGLSSNPNDIRIKKTAQTPAGEYVYFQQYLNDIPVFATNFTVFVNNDNIVRYALNEFRNVAIYGEIESSPSIADSEALNTANKYLNIRGEVIGKPKTELVYVESMDKGLELAWKVNINPMVPMGSWQLFVSASDGHIIHVEDISMIF